MEKIMEIDRTEVIAAWDDLQDVIGDYQRGRLDDSVVRQAHADYRVACIAAGEGWYALGNIAHDDMPGIDFTYPSDIPLTVKTEWGLYLTDYMVEKYHGRRYPRA
jgi:hypothetical protein